MRLAAKIIFPDHHRYAPNDLNRLVTTVRKMAASALVTTEKGQVRLGKLSASLPESLPLLTAGLRVEIESESEVVHWLMNRLGATPLPPPL